MCTAQLESNLETDPLSCDSVYSKSKLSKKLAVGRCSVYLLSSEMRVTAHIFRQSARGDVDSVVMGCTHAKGEKLGKK